MRCYIIYLCILVEKYGQSKLGQNWKFSNVSWLKYVFSPYTFIRFGHWSLHFFCLELVPTLCKNIGIGPSVNFLLKKTQNYWYWSLHFVKILVLVPRGIGPCTFFVWFFFRATWSEMIGPCGTRLVVFFF